MSPERSPEAERVLMRVRTSADPALDIERRVLASVEQRIALEGDLTRIDAAGGTGGAALLSSSASRWRQASYVAGRLSRWAAFGIVAGAIGYHFGWTAHERAASPAVAPAAVVSATPDAARAATTPTEPALVEPPPAQPAPEQPSPAQPASADLAPAESPATSPALPERTPKAPMLEPSALAVEDVSRAAAGRTRLLPSEQRGTPATKPGIPPRPLTLAELLERLLRAQTSLRASDPHAALEELAALDALDTGGSRALTEERLVLRALALCDIGRVSDARRALSELDRLGAASIYRGRLEQGCPTVLPPRAPAP